MTYIYLKTKYLFLLTSPYPNPVVNYLSKKFRSTKNDSEQQKLILCWSKWPQPGIFVLTLPPCPFICWITYTCIFAHSSLSWIWWSYPSICCDTMTSVLTFIYVGSEYWFVVVDILHCNGEHTVVGQRRVSPIYRSQGDEHVLGWRLRLTV